MPVSCKCCWADHSSRGVIPNVVSECSLEASIMMRPWPTGAVAS